MTHSCFCLCQVVSELFSILAWQTAETKKHSVMKMIIECRPFRKQSVLKRRDPSFNFENSMMQSVTLQLFKVMMLEGIITLWVVTNIDMSTTDGSDDEPMLYRNAGQNGGNMRRHNRQVQGYKLKVDIPTFFRKPGYRSLTWLALWGWKIFRHSRDSERKASQDFSLQAERGSVFLVGAIAKLSSSPTESTYQAIAEAKR